MPELCNATTDFRDNGETMETDKAVETHSLRIGQEVWVVHIHDKWGRVPHYACSKNGKPHIFLSTATITGTVFKILIPDTG